MRRLGLLIVLMMVSGIVLVGCSGDVGDGEGMMTPIGTPVSMATFKGLYYGTATPGTQMDFTLAGSDSQGNPWTGSAAVVSDGPTTFESQSVTKSRTLLTLQRGADTPVTGIVSYYHLASNSTLYKSVSSDGVECVPTTQTVIPNTINVGDFDNFENTNNSDGTTSTVTWILEPLYDGASKFVITSIERTGATIDYVEEDSFYLDSSGVPYGMGVKVTEGYFTATLSVTLYGSRNY